MHLQVPNIVIISFIYTASSTAAAGKGPADVAACHVRSEQGDPQRPGPGAAGRLQAHVAHRGPRHRVSDPAADPGRRGAAV